jgi:hypothetical protein
VFAGRGSTARATPPALFCVVSEIRFSLMARSPGLTLFVLLCIAGITDSNQDTQSWNQDLLNLHLPSRVARIVDVSHCSWSPLSNLLR